MNVKKPKPPLFISRRHLEETVVELKTDYPTALNRLRQMGGVCRNTDSNGYELLFVVNRDGRIGMADASSFGRRYSTRSAFLSGGLYAEEGKTKAVVYTYSSAVARAVKAAYLSVLVLSAFLVLTAAWLGSHPSPLGWVGVGLFAVALVVTVGGWMIHFGQTEYDATEDARRLQEEAVRRIKAIDQWDK
jgi:hypothetical protein